MADVSATGARLVIDAEIEIPSDIILVLSKGGKVSRRCRVTRRSDVDVGVEFDFD
jgi:hypothetical protein